MKTFISTEDFRQVLELLGLPDDTLHIEIGGRARAENGNTGMLMTGVKSTWGMKAVIAVPGSYDHENHRNLEPYSTRTVYVPVLLENDWQGRLATAEPNTWVTVPDYVFEEILVDRFGSIEAAEQYYRVKISSETDMNFFEENEPQVEIIQTFKEGTRYLPDPNHWSEHRTDAEVAASPVKACLPIPCPPIPYPLVTSRPSPVPPETPFAAANPGTGAYGDGPYVASAELGEVEAPRE